MIAEHWSVRHINTLICALIIWVPASRLWADTRLFEEAARAGQTFGAEKGAAVTLPGLSGSTLHLPQGKTVKLQDLFPGASQGDVSNFSNLYGNDAAVGAAGTQAQSTLRTDPSAVGSAYESLRGTLGRERPELSEDALWQGTDHVVDNFHALAAGFRDCKQRTTFQQNTRITHIPELHVCERYEANLAKYHADCTIDHDYAISALGIVQSDTWEEDPQCLIPALGLTRGGCTDGTVRCNHMPGLDQNGCIPTAGAPVCEAALAPSPVEGVSSLCQQIGVQADCTLVAGPMDCWTDPKGQIHCPWNAGGNEQDCAHYESNPDCARIQSICIEGAVNEEGQCYAWDETYDCGMQREVPSLSRTSEMDCSGPVRCLGDDCVKLENEQSTDFAGVVAALSSTQSAASDSQCTSTACYIFDGKALQCKKAVGGYVDCCKTPDGVSLSDYIQLLYSTGKLASLVMTTEQKAIVRGAWETLSGPVTEVYGAVKSSFSSIANSLMGNTTAHLSDLSIKAATMAFQQALMQQAATWTAQVFGDAAANAIFMTSEGGAAVVGGTVQAGATIQFTTTIAAIYSVVMTAFLIYAIVTILIKIIWRCTKKEFELGARRALKSCHRVGSYCKKKVLGLCIEKRTSYCCFNTPLARILNEQVRPQIRRGWGSGKHPDCRGLDAEELDRVDWSRIDLSEWLDILKTAGYYPDDTMLDIEKLTGEGSDYSVGDSREASSGRTNKRAEAFDGQTVHKEAEQELWRDVNRRP